MRRQFTGFVALAAGAILAGGLIAPLHAHHAFSAEFDAARPIRFEKATVTKMQWTNPHVWIYVDVTQSDGTVEDWAIEAGSPNILYRRGFTKAPCCPELRSSWRVISRRTDRDGRMAGISRYPMAPSCFSARRARAPHMSCSDPVSTRYSRDPLTRHLCSA